MTQETQGRVTDLKPIERPEGVPDWCSAFMAENGVVYLWDGRLHVDVGRNCEHLEPALESLRGARMTEAGLYPRFEQMVAPGFEWPTENDVTATLAVVRTAMRS